MKLFYNISPVLKKIIAIFLLLYFIVSPLLFAFPVQECSSSCPMTMEMENCDMQMNEMETHECNMDMSNSNTSSNGQSCDMEVSANSCMIVKYFDSTFKFVITQKYHSVNTLTIVSMLDQFTDDSKTTIHKENNQTFQSEKSPPIYISVQSFLN